MLTQACATSEKAFVEVFIIDADCLYEGRVHADHPLPEPRSEKKYREKLTKNVPLE